jgi:hypothetical protein
VLLEVRSGCDQRAPVVNYSSVNIELPHGTLVVPFPLADRCGGVGSPGIGVTDDNESTHDAVNAVNIDVPGSLPRGRPTTIQVTLDSFAGTDLRHFG